MDSSITDALQFSYMVTKDPLNTTGAPRMTITFQYATTVQPDDLPTNTVFTGWTALTAAEKAAVEAQMDHIETFLNVSFVEVVGDDDPDLNIGKVTLSGSTSGLGGNSISSSGTTIVEADSFAVYDNTIDISAAAQVNLILHELGHALGMKHPFTGSPTLPAGTDNNKYTVMSYTDNPDTGDVSDAMMLYDLASLQDMWGAADYNTGNTTYAGPRNPTVDTIWDTGGTDTLDASAKTTAVTLDLREGAFSAFGGRDDVVIAYGVEIENAIGGKGNDDITGNDLNNRLKGGGGADGIAGAAGKDKLIGGGGKDAIAGGSGNDSLKGGGGRDRLDGGSGNDKLTGNKGKDKFVFKAGSGDDTVRDFTDGEDRLIVKNLGAASEVLALANEVGSDVVFDFGSDGSLTLLNATIAQISDDIFV